MSKPYVYKIIGENDEIYYGVRWDYIGEPVNDLWIKYFTSSLTVNVMIEKNGVKYFKPYILKIFENEKEALDYEYNLIKENLNNPLLLNKAIGKCTIWNDILKKQVSKSVKELWKNEDYKINAKLKSSGINNHNFRLKPWDNVNSNIESWIKVKKIYEDHILENWKIGEYGFGRYYLMKRYNICQGTARKFISLIKENWNPINDEYYMNFYIKNAPVS